MVLRHDLSIGVRLLVKDSVPEEVKYLGYGANFLRF